MNLIEQLGGYEEAKELRRYLFCYVDGEHYTDVDKDLLEYRRQHNIFEVGDKVVFDNTKDYCRLLPDDLMTYKTKRDIDAIVNQGSRDFAVSYVALRHAKPEEIKAGKRL